MPPQPSYKTLEIYNLSKKLVARCYALTSILPQEEKSNLSHFIRSSAVTAHLNIAKGVFLKKKKGRKPFIQSALNALVVIDAAIEVLHEVGMVKEEETSEIIEISSACYLGLTQLKKRN